MSFTKFKYIVAEKIQQKQSQDITIADLKTAEEFLIIQEQQLLIQPKDIKQFKLIKDENGIYRNYCRFDHAELINPHPIFLPKKSPLIKIIIQHFHEKLHHAGIPHTLSKIRETFWIPTGRNIVKQVLGKCKSCKYWKGKSFDLPHMPQLPSTRVNNSKPFQNVGIDYGGPFKIKGNQGKVWISLFTCFTTRMIHLEPVTSMDSENFLSAFRRFVARRGVPNYILSDNAKQFKTAATALDQIFELSIKDANLIQYCNDNSIVWDYITERAPWKGGLYERMIGLVKNALKQTIGRKFLNLVDFWTFLCEVESTINSRPLTYVHANEPFVIRPADFVSPGIQINLPTVTVDNESEDPMYLPSTAHGGERLVERYKKTLEHLDKFWNLWNKDYLNFLRERNDNEHKTRRGSIKRQPQINEMVLVYEPDVARGLWKVAKIKELIISNDNEVRSAKIEYKDGFETRRAVNHLYPIEESSVDLESETDLNQKINLHILVEKNENQVVSNIFLQPRQYSHSLSSLSSSSLQSSTMTQKSSSNISLELEDISSRSLSDTESEKLHKEIQKTRKAETILRKNIKNMKDILREIIDTSPIEYRELIQELESRVGKGEKAGDIAIKLQQFNEKIINTIKARDEAFEELKDVRSEGTQARQQLKDYRRNESGGRECREE
uniref:Integrase catalytic domain-containing protein n=1 Tax=Panagrolaimus superbus TaxID=310955 RepID=A0A914YX01_9BILA